MDDNTRRLIAGAAGVESKTYIEDVFSTYLYTGNGSTQTITNGIDLAGKGGLVWIKCRNNIRVNSFFDTNRGAPNFLSSNSTDLQLSGDQSLISFNNNGFTLGSDSIYFNVNQNSFNHASWTFRKAAKFFDVVTWTGDGNITKTISHSLGSVPGCIIGKSTSASDSWRVYHRSLSTSDPGLKLNTTAAGGNSPYDYGDYSIVTTPTSTQFTVGTNLNNSGVSYVAYLFAHDTTTDGLIQCGSFTTDGSGNATVSLGWETQWVLVKRSDSSGVWFLLDTLRGWTNPSNNSYLQAQDAAAEVTGWASGGYPTSTGFYWSGVSSATYIYIAIRRGPMKTPTDATKVFDVDLMTGAGTVSTGFPIDLTINTTRSGNNRYFIPRIAFPNGLTSNNTNAESSTSPYFDFASNTSITVGNWWGSINEAVYYSLRRAPGFFDVVAFTSNASGFGATFNHSLGVIPELVIMKSRGAAADWYVWNSSLASDKLLYLNSSVAVQTALGGSGWLSATSSAITVTGTLSNNNLTHIAYLFASCPGVSKVGRYTGTGTTLNVDCGFTNGARFVLIKRTDSSGDWYVWDTARGITSGNDPYLLLNSTAAEVTNTDYIDPYAAGFEISSTAPAAINANGGSYIYLAIA